MITEPKQTKFNSFEEIFENYLKINFKPIENRIIIAFDYYFVNNNKYEKAFKQIEKLGKGSYGKVFKVEKLNKYSNEEKIKFKAEYEKEFLNELETSIVYELRNKNIMKYHDIWLENDYFRE